MMVANILKILWLGVGVCGAVWFGAHGDWKSAAECLGIGTAGAVTNHIAHLAPSPR